MKETFKFDTLTITPNNQNLHHETTNLIHCYDYAILQPGSGSTRILGNFHFRETIYSLAVDGNY